MEEIRRAFQLFDDDNTGKITLRNLRRVAKEIGDRLEDDELCVARKAYPRRTASTDRRRFPSNYLQTGDDRRI